MNPIWLARLGWLAVGGVVIGGSAGTYGTFRDIGRGVRENGPLLIAVGAGLSAYMIYKK
jgi:hypothetical protein